MAFGINDDAGGSSQGEFLGRMQYDSRTGFWKTVDRVQGSDGWQDQESDLMANPTFLVDFGSIETGHIRFASPPVFLVTPFWDFPKPVVPVGPDGKSDKAYKVGFRVKLMSKKQFGDANPRYFSSNAKLVVDKVERLFKAFCASPEAVAGKVPLVEQTGLETIEITSKEGKAKYKAPIWEIKGWHDRPEALGERTVPAPSKVLAAPPPVAKPVQEAQAKPAPSHDLNDEVPF